MSEPELAVKLRAAYEFVQKAGELGEVEGFLHPLEGYTLFLLAQHGPGDGAIVEIGSYMGLSTCWMACGSKSAGREPVTAIDHFTGSPEHQKGGGAESAVIQDSGTTFHVFSKNIASAGVADRVQPIQKSSLEAAEGWREPIRLLFIDGDHSYEAVRSDFETWTPFVQPGGMIAMHDVQAAPDVTRLYEEVSEPGGGYTQFIRVNNLGVLVKGQS